MNKFFLAVILLFSSLIVGCNRTNQESDLINTFTIYYEAVKSKDDSKWNFTSDTVNVWFEKSDDKPSLRYKGKKVKDYQDLKFGFVRMK